MILFKFHSEIGTENIDGYCKIKPKSKFDIKLFLFMINLLEIDNTLIMFQ